MTREAACLARQRLLCRPKRRVQRGGPLDDQTLDATFNSLCTGGVGAQRGRAGPQAPPSTERRRVLHQASCSARPAGACGSLTARHCRPRHPCGPCPPALAVTDSAWQRQCCAAEAGCQNGPSSALVMAGSTSNGTVSVGGDGRGGAARSCGRRGPTAHRCRPRHPCLPTRTARVSSADRHSTRLCRAPPFWQPASALHRMASAWARLRPDAAQRCAWGLAVSVAAGVGGQLGAQRCW